MARRARFRSIISLLASVLVSTSSPSQAQAEATTTQQAIVNGYADMPGVGDPPPTLDRIVRTNVAGDRAVALVRAHVGPGKPYDGYAFLVRFPFGWQLVDEARPCLFAVWGVDDADQRALTVGMPKLPTYSCSSENRDSGPESDVTAIRQLRPQPFGGVAVAGAYAASGDYNTCHFYRRDAGVWSMVTKCSSKGPFLDGYLDSFGFTFSVLCAVGYEPDQNCTHDGILNDRYVSSFRSPTGNTGCTFDRDGNHLYCDVVGGIVPLPQKPKNCSTWGQGYEISATGSAEIECGVEGSALDHGPTIEYGTTVELYSKSQTSSNTLKLVLSVTCTSRDTGLTCKNTSGHGFFLARGEASKF